MVSLSSLYIIFVKVSSVSLVLQLLIIILLNIIYYVNGLYCSNSFGNVINSG